MCFFKCMLCLPYCSHFTMTKIRTFSGSLLRHASTNSLKGFEQLPVSWGGLFLGIRKRTLMGCNSELGGSPLASSMAVMPRDQMSALLSQQDCLMTSGAIQNGVPTNVFRLLVVFVNWPATPGKFKISLTVTFMPKFLKGL